ncbi:N-acetylmuramoyl-L-alanine amidase-like domain-containing protein [Marinomonas posidonica]|uniref:DUF1460 domain-containing protein n=1 Tax=Marinomonas posidonica (strain CECT 7376 / NCIMB 14433 / IVIA-Po-181) TaxID=491952 RepID=F6CTD1_MARPP|nr:N-acetylmuramoyl-L-alanine amidase-like domain-containing protein [Marinomonas posidonica]AEF53980.1 protein of unknown function DUF1460 [Marinomonas posidonica IVIA-Po-181]
MKKHWQGLFFLVGGLFGGANASDFEHTKDPNIESVFYQSIATQTDSMNVVARVERLSHLFMGAPYVGGNAGEGVDGQFDKDPLIRFDVFDCTTYVETVLAGIQSISAKSFKDNLIKIRYQDGLVNFVQRNHFPSLDWLPNNRELLQDITDRVAQDQSQRAITQIDRAAWYRHLSAKSIACKQDCKPLLEKLHETGQHFQIAQADIPYVPLSALFLGPNKQVNQALLDRIPSGSVINMVRPNWALKKWIGTNLNVSHQGLVLRQGGRLILRHASVTHQKVVDEDFIDYFAQYDESSSLKGFNLQLVRL